MLELSRSSFRSIYRDMGHQIEISLGSSDLYFSVHWNFFNILVLKKYVNNRLLGRFVPIFHFYCENVHFMYIVKQKQTKLFADFMKKFRGFLKILKITFWWRQTFENSIIHYPSLGSCEVLHKRWVQSVQPFWRILIRTNRQTSKVYI